MWLFPGRNPEKHITRQALWARLKRACRLIGVDPDGLSPHSLRKSFAVAIRQEQGFAAAREALQHDSDAVTRVYAYADTIMRAASDDPVRWNELELIVDYILERLHEKGVD
jgi:integrase